MQLLPCADRADSVTLAVRSKCGRQDHRDSPGITKEVASRVDIVVTGSSESSVGLSVASQLKNERARGMKQGSGLQQ